MKISKEKVIFTGFVSLASSVKTGFSIFASLFVCWLHVWNIHVTDSYMNVPDRAKPTNERFETQRLILLKRKGKAYSRDVHSISTQQDSLGQANGIETEELGVIAAEYVMLIILDGDGLML